MKPKTLLPVLVIAGTASIVTAGPRSYTTEHSHIDSYPLQQPRTILLQTPRDGVLQNRLYDRGGVRSFTASGGANEYVTSSPLPYGAPIEAADELVVVRPREAVPYIAISPWEPITDRTIDELRRFYPELRRTESIEQDLRIAQNQYLRERGYIASVRGFRNDGANQRASAAREAPSVMRNAPESAPGDPQLVITQSDAQDGRSVVNERLKSESVIRVRSSSDQED